MISNSSILRRLPVALDPKQALFIDGIRHAVEIAYFAYIRLGQTLTDLATQDYKSEVLATKTTSAFLDAWAIIDAIDRFCSLWKKLPNATPAKLPQGSKSIDDVYKPIRDLRNVADHLAQRADFIIAKKSSALGALTWFSGLKQEPLAGWVCAIVPGSITQRSGGQFSDPFETSEEWPTRNIWLSAAGFSANLSEIFPHVQIRITRLEESLEKAISRQPEVPTPANSDMLVKYKISPGELQPKIIATAVGLRGQTPEVAPGDWSLIIQHTEGNAERNT
jgi:hypothetical protein